MRDLKQYWAEVRAIERELPPFVWLMSLDDEGGGGTVGVMTEVPAAPAAKLLQAQSHRLATTAEIAAHVERQSAAARGEVVETLRRQGITIVPVLKPPQSAVAKPPARVSNR